MIWIFLTALVVFFAHHALAVDLNSDDQHRLKRAIAYAIQDDWQDFERLSQQIESPLARKYLQWRRHLSADEAKGYHPVLAFLDANDHWPATGELQAVAERMLDERVDFADRRSFFSKKRPLTKEGKLALAEALLDSDELDAASEIIRKAWVHDNFGTSEIRRIKALFGNILRKEDHTARLDRLLWDGQWRSAESMIALVDKGRQAWARARIKLQRFQGGVDGAVRAVPRAFRAEPGLMYDRLHWRRRKGLRDGAIEILLSPPDELGRSQPWWYERIIQIREKLDDRRFSDAARLAKSHRQTSGLSQSEAEWMAGWLSLRKLNEPKTALKRFETMFENVRSPISKGRAGYWAGRAATAAGNETLGKEWYQKAAQFGTSFYGQEAAFELGIEPILTITPLPEPVFDKPFDELADVAAMLCHIDEGDAAVVFLRHLALEAGMAPSAMALALSCGRPDIVIELAKFAIRAGVADPLWSFPKLLDVLQGVDADIAPLAMAVSRQESHFDAVARSGAGAQGLMQLMPRTARSMARKASIRFEENQLRSDPALNMRLGSSYLSELHERFDGDLAMIAAGYNAGPSRVNRWAKRHGDPRTLSRHKWLDWIELIPFSETRNYVHRVIEGKNVYASLLARGEGIEVELHRPLGDLVPAMFPRPKPR